MPIQLPTYTPQVNQGSMIGLPPSDDFSTSVVKGYQAGKILSGIAQEQEALKIAQLRQQMESEALQQEQLRTQIAQVPFARSKLVSDIAGEPGIVPNMDTGPVIPTGASAMDETMRFAAPEGGGQVPSDTIPLKLPGYPGLGRSPSLRISEEVAEDERQRQRLLDSIMLRTQGQKEVVQEKAKFLGGGMTPYQMNQLILRGSKAGVSPDQFRGESGEIDWNEYAKAAGNAEFQVEKAKLEASLNAIPAETKNKVLAMQVTQEHLLRFKDMMYEMAKTADVPTPFDNAIAASVRQPPENFFGALYQQGMKSLQSETSKQLEARKSAVSASLIRAYSGLAQTIPEIANSAAMRPLETDDFPTLLWKMRNLEEFINDEIRGYTRKIGSQAGAGAAPTENLKASSQWEIVPE